MLYFLENPMRDIPHQEVVDWAVEEWKLQTGCVLRDPDRAIRKLHSDGKLVKVSQGVYRYDPDYVHDAPPEDFTPKQKRNILERGGYKCAVCGATEASGAVLHIDHIKPKHKGGKAEVSNGQILCSVHNFRKGTYDQTESGKQMFANLLELAEKEGDEQMIGFCLDVLAVYEKYDINGHIEW